MELNDEGLIVHTGHNIEARLVGIGVGIGVAVEVGVGVGVAVGVGVP